MRFRNGAKQCHAAQRAWFDAEDIRALDESKENYHYYIYFIKGPGHLLLTTYYIF